MHRRRRRRARCGTSRCALRSWWPTLGCWSSHLLDHGRQLTGHGRYGLAAQLHRPACALPDDDVERAVARVLVRVVVAEVAAAALAPLESRPRNGLGDRQEVAQVERGVPTRIVLAITIHAHPCGSRSELFDPSQRLAHVVLLSHDAHQVLHRLLERLLYLIRSFSLARATIERLERAPSGVVRDARVHRDLVVRARERSGVLAGALAE